MKDEEKRVEWVLCPLCRGKTRLKLLPETVLKNFPLFCPKCRREMLISAEQFAVSIVRE
ncbi:cysteine-rich KTR domain-containing protein [Butyricicoccus sp.]|uniref:cysteine-rich KTR domain-containing protein n=1 Tax=Butyricicoccus sp. TaxID=2049021 RepID=UPI0037354631